MSPLQKLRARFPTRDQISQNRWLAWLGPWLHHPKLWHWSRRGVALGVSLGVFFGLIIPIAQIPLSVTAAVVLRANIPAAIASTLVSNPVTFGPIYYGAYRLGVWVTGEAAPLDATNVIELEKAKNPSLWQRIGALGKPLLVGLSITAALTGLVTYALITLVWRWRTMSKRRKRML
ncbi:MAG: DUF2062 domain-containing protein [Gammaproteobacteria bacterium]|uniref:DUF2062 domain-containing protein n=1 Tax=Rhodoferax sp. TaxID=50421 RepID=UPI00184F4B40|nr:DUF2062 domain-containing protein [Rhodoferax sp.]MBU3900971.1 DUF2062 domain-containing protein [Gammaproteobacteria bacterium]MBA3058337.1 DUF2062 domain-containing protein [Rhodoferax sp.]MBU3996800.1 DUF2062 domain-containing protein [Gammaproteobacteria bacterium]MBU4017645.1 DUF2062 domain-containing protein [Gammaproteobacteria bacterium]MBU4081088.1 DUF2062 domain-containing protein [Gammaproteobacteria bacterium]